MSVTTDYDKLYIAFDSWGDVPTIDKLVCKMATHYFAYHDKNWNDYLKEHYSLNITVHDNGYHDMLLFDNKQTFEQFIARFIDMPIISSKVIINYDKLLLSWKEWKDAPTINKLATEMWNKKFKWWETNWNKFLKKNYKISGNVIHLHRRLLAFRCVSEMQLFILNFM